MKVLTEEQKQLKQEILSQYNEERAKIEEAYNQQKAILEQQKEEAESRQQTMSIVLITVVAVLLVGIAIFAMIKLTKHFKPVARQVKEEEKVYDRVDFNSTSKNVGITTEYEQQFDAKKEFEYVDEMKVIPGMTELATVNILQNNNMINLKSKVKE